LPAKNCWPILAFKAACKSATMKAQTKQPENQNGQNKIETTYEVHYFTNTVEEGKTCEAIRHLFK